MTPFKPSWVEAFQGHAAQACTYGKLAQAAAMPLGHGSVQDCTSYSTVYFE